MQQWYIGHKGGRLEAFRCNHLPTSQTHGHEYLAVLGPFDTVRAALWAEAHGLGNPHMRTVEDAERLCRLN